MKNLSFRCKFFFAIACSLVFIVSCNKEEELGLEIQPLEDRITVGFSNGVGLTAYSLRDDSIRTDKTLVSLLGSYFDPVFGFNTAGFYVQLRLPNTNVDFGPNPVLDSIVLSLVYTGNHYGKLAARQRVHVYEILEGFNRDSAYYAYTRLHCSPVDLANKSFVPRPRDSVQLGGLRFAPQLRMKLDPSLGQKFLNASATPDLEDNTKFLEFFKGLHVIAEPLYVNGAILYFNLLNSQSKLTLFYRNDEKDSLTYNFVINDNSGRFNIFDHRGYSGAEQNLQRQIAGDTARGNKTLYVQAMGGIKTFIRLPDLKPYLNDGRAVINKAELVITPQPGTAGDFPYPEQLTLAKINADNSLAFVPDQFFGASYFGGTYNSTKGEYRFNLAVFIQNILRDETAAGKGLYLAISGASVRGDRLVINGPGAESGNLRLEITYTNLK